MDSYTVNAGSNGNFSAINMGILEEFNAELDAELKEAIHAGGKAARTYARSNAPRSHGSGGGKYRRSISLRVDDTENGRHSAVVYSPRLWMMIHLLDQGHDSYNQYGGPYRFVKGDQHFTRANEEGKRVIERMLGVKL